eukprot:1122383-Prymnesium_polylepis.2
MTVANRGVRCACSNSDTSGSRAATQHCSSVRVGCCGSSRALQKPSGVSCNTVLWSSYIGLRTTSARAASSHTTPRLRRRVSCCALLRSAAQQLAGYVGAAREIF